jgi:GNAT superfamily N-acetyltransferase
MQDPIIVSDWIDPPLNVYGNISSSFTASEVFDLIADPGAPGGNRLTARKLSESFEKVYDVPGNKPADWPKRFDTKSWRFIQATIAGRRVGVAAVVARSPQINLLESRDDLALLWDIRVAPEFRGIGVGVALWNAAVAWALGEGLRELRVETQQINAAACRFYQRRGATLHQARFGSYSPHPDEVQLIFSLTLK